nr:(-)-isopiperitenol/(-)-carveol dehydrogenase, mitochondrial-like [Malus domestica]
MADPVDIVSVSQTIQKLQGKVAVVTGEASGISEATTRKFALHVARAMVITDVLDGKGQNVVASIGPDHSIYIHCDVIDEDQVKILVESTIKIYGCLDMMFSNTGIGSASKQTVMDLNLFPVCNSLTHSFCSHLQRDNGSDGRRAHSSPHEFLFRCSPRLFESRCQTSSVIQSDVGRIQPAHHLELHLR